MDLVIIKKRAFTFENLAVEIALNNAQNWYKLRSSPPSTVLLGDPPIIIILRITNTLLYTHIDVTIARHL